MKKRMLFVFTVITLGILAFGAIRASAATSGIYTYEVSGGTATITVCDKNASGAIVIPDELGGYPVTSIGSSAFYNCTGLTSIEIPNGVVHIGSSAFEFCFRLTSITIPDSVTSIGDDAFAHCTGLTSITIPDSVTSIGSFAFYNCGLTSVTIGSNVANIGAYAFSSCYYLESVYITNLVAYLNCTYEDFGSNPMCSADNLYLNGEIVTELTIPEGVTKIPEYAFSNCTGLKSVTIGNGVTSIGGSAFYNCTGLTSVYITDLAAYISCEYGDRYSNPMYYAAKLYINGKRVVKITIPEGVTQIPLYAFYGCDSLTSVTIPNSVTSIGDEAFSGCKGLTSVTIGNGVTSIGSGAFRSCTGLTSVTIPNSVTSIGGSAFYNCAGLTQINWNAKNVTDFYDSSNVFAYAGQDGSGIQVTFGDGVEKIPAYIFYIDNPYYKSPKITSVTIGNSVTSIGGSAFSTCYTVESVYITNLAAYLNCTYEDYNSNPMRHAGNLYLNGELVTELTIPEGVTKIPEYAFSNCTGLTSITMPDSVTSIGSSAFELCTGLKSVTIGNGVTSIGYDAFYGCTGLTSITMPDSVTSIGSSAFELCTGLKSVTIGNGVTSIGSSAFSNCTGLIQINWNAKNVADFSSDSNVFKYVGKSGDGIKVIFGEGVEKIPEYIFYSSDSSERPKITSVTIGNSVTSIGDDAFAYCTGLTSITIPDSVTSIGSFAFYNCTGLTSATIGNSVTSVGSYAFAYCTGLTSITIPDSVTSIGSSAFYKCTGLTSITIGNSVASIGSYAFYGCTGLTSVTIGNSVTSIGSYAFELCTGLTQINWNAKNVADFSYDSDVFTDAGKRGTGIKVIFGDSVERIPGYIFCPYYSSERPKITSVTMGNSVTSIGKSAFDNCTGLTSITIPDSVTSIGKSAFYNCTGLTSITIGNGVKYIDENVFSDCTSLTEILIPISVIEIEYGAFSGCSGLKNVYYSGSEEEWEEMYVGADNKYFTGATRHYNQRVKPVISKNNQIYTVSFANNALGNSAIGKSVIVALYNDDKFVEMVSAVYNGTELEFVTTKPHTSAKVMVWGSFADMQPACHAEVTN